MAKQKGLKSELDKISKAIDNAAEANLCSSTIEELLAQDEWTRVLTRLSSMNFLISYSDKKAIIRSDAPDWLKNATFICKTIPSC